MVKTTRTKAGSSALRPLNAPRGIPVKFGEDGEPRALSVQNRWLDVTSVEDRWSLADEWWRGQPVSRAYFEVLLADGRRLTVFQDTITGEWYQQRYG